MSGHGWELPERLRHMGGDRAESASQWRALREDLALRQCSGKAPAKHRSYQSGTQAACLSEELRSAEQ